VHDEVLELLMDLEATPEQFNCPFLYTSSRLGTATLELDEPGTTLTPLFDTILGTIPPPKATEAGPFQMLISTLDYSSILGGSGSGASSGAGACRGYGRVTGHRRAGSCGRRRI